MFDLVIFDSINNGIPDCYITDNWLKVDAWENDLLIRTHMHGWTPV